MQNSEEKQGYIEPRRCEHCGNITPMTTLATHRKIDKVDTTMVDSDVYLLLEVAEGRRWTMLLCPVCSGIIILQDSYTIGETRHAYEEPIDFDFDGTEEQGDSEVLFPSHTNDVLDLPEKVAKEYLSALNIRNVDTNAFSVLLGRTLDAVCMDRLAEGDTLYLRLNFLAKKGEIPKRLVEMAHSLRTLRNMGAHADLGDLPAEVVPVLESLCKAILEYVYVAPKLIERVSYLIEDLKKTEESADDTEVDDDISS